MSQRVHADTEHRRGENLKRKKTKQNKQNKKTKNKTQKWHYLSPQFPGSTPSPPQSVVGEKLAPGLAEISNCDKRHLPVARKRCMAKRSCGDILTFISLSVCLKAEKSCFLSRWATFFFVLLSAEGGMRKGESKETHSIRSGLFLNEK